MKEGASAQAAAGDPVVTVVVPSKLTTHARRVVMHSSTRHLTLGRGVARLFLATALGCFAASAQAQERKIEDLGIETVSLDTKDGVNIKCRWYPGNKGKDTVPIIMLHGYQGSGVVYDGLATALCLQGHAVAVPDLRGHGGSLTRLGSADPIELARMRPTDFAAMMLDVEAVKKFLMEKNNKGELNIEMLTVVGAEMGGALALRWAMQDWKWPQLQALKQGQDVKALVLLSPERSFKGINATDALSFPVIRDQMSIMLAVGGKDPSAVRDAKRIYSGWERNRPEPTQEEAALKKNLFWIEVDTNLQGTQLLDPRLGLWQQINGFLKLRLEDKKEQFAWRDRTSPLSRN
jgi:pimeloyl-ACP methyl ester carboxylesterase